MNTDEFAKKLRSLRQSKNLTQEELAARLFVSRKTVSKWETGRGLPDTVLFPAMGEILGTSTDELFGAVPSDYYSELRRNTDESALYARAYRAQRFRTLALGASCAVLAAALIVFVALFLYFRGAYTDTFLRAEYTLLYKDYSSEDAEWTEQVFTEEEFRTSNYDLTIEAEKGSAILVAFKKTEYDRDGNKQGETFYESRMHYMSLPTPDGIYERCYLAEGLPAEYFLEDVPALNKPFLSLGGGDVTYCVWPGTHRIEFHDGDGQRCAQLRVMIPEDDRERAELSFQAEEGGSISERSPISWSVNQSRFPYPVVEGSGFGSLTLRDESGTDIAVFDEISDLVSQDLACGGRIVVIYEAYPDQWREYFSERTSVYTVRIQLIGSEKYRDVSMVFDFYCRESP